MMKIKIFPIDLHSFSLKIDKNKILLKYTELRLQAFELFKKAIQENNGNYNDELDKIHFQIDQELEKLNN